MQSGIRIRTCAVLLVLASGVLMAADLNVGPATKSTVSASFKQEALWWTTHSRLHREDQLRPAESRGRDGEHRCGNRQPRLRRSGLQCEIARKSWFDSATYRRQLPLHGDQAAGRQQFEATGTLAIKGKVQTIVVPVTVTAAPAGSVFDGSLVISRKAFGIGDAQWDDVLDDRSR